MNKLGTFFFCFFILLCASRADAQSTRYFVQFKDKNNTPYSLQSPSHFVSKRTIDRRKNYQIPFTFSDLPVNPDYVAQVKAIPNVQVRYVTKWFNGVVVSAADGSDETAMLGAISSLPFVQSSSKVRRLKRITEVQDSTQKRSSPASGSGITEFDYGQALNQAEQLNIDCFHKQNYRGQGMMIAVMDAGFASVPVTDVFDSLRLSGRLLGGRDFVNGGTNAYVGGDHGTMVLSCMAAIKPGTSIGTAPLASYWLLRTEEGGRETVSEEYNWIRAAEFADSVGADILTTSLGYTNFDDSTMDHSYQDLDGRTAPMSIAATMAARKGMFVLNAAGNEGDKSWFYVSVPGDADSICTVGSVNGAGIKSAFSSHGPTADGRIKPDFMAKGEGCWVCSGTVCFPGNGTSFATPVLAGAVACYWQANQDLNNIGLLSLMRSKSNGKDSANNRYGWGIPFLDCPATPYVPPDTSLPVPTTMNFTAHVGANSVHVSLPRGDYKTLDFRVTDLLGQELFHTTLPGDHYQAELLTPSLAAGVYIVRVTSPFGEQTRKVLKLGL